MSTVYTPSRDRGFTATVAAVADRVAARLPSGLVRRLRPSAPRLPVAEAVPGLGPDRLLCAAVLLLTAVGVVMVFSAGAVFASRKYGDWTYFLKREAIYSVVGLAGFAFAVRTDYGGWRRSVEG